VSGVQEGKQDICEVVLCTRPASWRACSRTGGIRITRKALSAANRTAMAIRNKKKSAAMHVLWCAAITAQYHRNLPDMYRASRASPTQNVLEFLGSQCIQMILEDLFCIFTIVKGGDEKR